jgi:hypothetical protein
VIRHGIDPTTAGGREQARVYFRTLMARVNGEVGEYARTIESARGGAELAARSTLFRTHGLSSDTSIRPDFAVDHALESLLANGMLRAGSVRRVGVIGPGLDFTDKAEGYDFYPPHQCPYRGRAATCERPYRLYARPAPGSRGQMAVRSHCVLEIVWPKMSGPLVRTWEPRSSPTV